MRALANTLPLLARQLNLAAGSWAREQTLYARARDLLHTDDLVPAILTNSVVPATAEHLVPVVATIRVAERLSAALADELNRLAAPRGHQLMPATTRVPVTGDRQLRIDAERVARLARRVGQIEGPSRLAL